MIEQLRQTCRRLLEDVTVDVVIGYGESATGKVFPVFITEPADAQRLVWNERCHHNLAVYLTRPEIRDMGRPAIVVKGCDARAIVVLQQESQIDRRQMYVIGVACEGVGDPRAEKCATCDAHVPRNVDVVVGESAASAAGEDGRYRDVEALLGKERDDRLTYWRQELSRCTKCYACRAACPLCYCTRCIVDKNRPTAIDTSATLQGNFAWHIARAMHLAGRCVGCGECVRACHAGIRLDLLNAAVARSAEANFGYRAGTQPETPPVVGTYSLADGEAFIR